MKKLSIIIISFLIPLMTYAPPIPPDPIGTPVPIDDFIIPMIILGVLGGVIILISKVKQSIDDGS